MKANKPKILIAEDDKNMGYLLKENLKVSGFDPVLCINGQQGIDKFKSETFDLCLLDIMMPKMDGFETIKKIRSIPKYSKLLVIALTAHAMLDDKFIIESSGFNDLITKPIDNTTIQLKINQAILENERK